MLSIVAFRLIFRALELTRNACEFVRREKGQWEVAEYMELEVPRTVVIFEDFIFYKQHLLFKSFPKP